jgi:hypothetical protein
MIYSFKEEIIQLLKEHSVDYNEDYLITWTFSTHSGVAILVYQPTTDGTVAIGFWRLRRLSLRVLLFSQIMILKFTFILYL